MVNKLKKLKRISLRKTILTLCLMQVSVSYAGEFYTIIGPDGRPIVVQQPSQPKSKKIEVMQSKPSVAVASDKKQPDINHKETHPQKDLQENKTPAVASILESEIKRKSPQVSVNQESLAKPVKKTAIDKIKKESHPQIPVKSQPVQPLQTVAPIKVEQKQKKNETQVVTSTVQQDENSQASDAFVIIDDEKYIKNEYLEDKEFNLEGKKRFYAMPEGVIDIKHGATRLQLVEREKGVSQSILQSLFKKNQKQDTGPITLSSTYYRISQQNAINGLGQQCFQDKKIKNAKTVDLNKDVNIWPRAPLKDQFDFEIVKVSDAIQNIQINSYASRQQNPTFYWPFVVFLDSKGCVLEGAGGFKNHDTAASFRSHEKIEGVIHVPVNSQYLLLTPLASAIDLENRALTNHGQLKLIAIR